MFVVMNRLPVNPDYAEQFEERIRNRPRRVETQPGFIRVQLLRPSNPDDPYIVLTAWENRESFEAWVNDDSFTEKHADKRVLSSAVFRGPNRVETFEVIA